MQRWAIYIDIEGTSKIYKHNEVQFFASVNALLDGICRIGSQVYPESPNRLFVHQAGGDGFFIISEFAQTPRNGDRATRWPLCASRSRHLSPGERRCLPRRR